MFDEKRKQCSVQFFSESEYSSLFAQVHAAACVFRTRVTAFGVINTASERDAILQWLRPKNTSPTTGAKLENETSSRTLQHYIRSFAEAERDSVSEKGKHVLVDSTRRS